MMSTVRFGGLSAALLPLVLAGCLNLGPQENQTQFYVLGGEWSGEETISADGPSVGIRELALSSYLQTPLMVVRLGAHEVRFSEFHRWAEELQRGIMRTLAGRLEAMPEVGSVAVVPFRPGAQNDYTVSIHLRRFEGTLQLPEVEEAPPEGGALVVAEWEIAGGATGGVVRRGTTEFRSDAWGGSDYAELAALLDEGIGALAADIAAAIAGR